MAMPFSSPDEAIINTVVPLSELTLSSTSRAQGINVEELYDLKHVAQLIQENNFKRIALQFPDELLSDSSRVFWSLKDTLKRSKDKTEDLPELYILADTSYGNCCVDEVAAEHVDADLVVHFGHACLSLTARLPAIYVFHRLPINSKDCVEQITIKLQEQDEWKQKKLIMMYDVGYEHACTEICNLLKEKLDCEVLLSEMDKSVNFDRYLTQSTTNGHPQATGSSFASTSKNKIPDELEETEKEIIYLYIGPESLALTNLLLRLGPTATVVRYDAEKKVAQNETGRTNRLLQRRYVAVQKARDAQTIGLLVGTLGLRSYLPLLQHLRSHLTEVQGKRVYTISVGKLNPAKLANFQEIDVFVLVACPENSLVDAASGLQGAHDSRDFYKPIVTPFEVLTAFKGREWTGEYVLDLEQVYGQAQAIDAAEKDKKDDQESDDDDEPHFSLVTGGLISKRRAYDPRNKVDKQENVDEKSLITTNRQANDANEGIVTVRNADGTLTKVMESAGAAHLATRSWRGLEQRLGFDEPAALETGRSGIAQGYLAGEDSTKEGN